MNQRYESERNRLLFEGIAADDEALAFGFGPLSQATPRAVQAWGVLVFG
ncbi:hypothetical protein [Stenotrophomonas sp. MMGLT7]|nr:hypothetical protein [Stenotrophomonas sp. MMGLT7]MCD7099179.1 hypothetical protein [Stenotrophomonas sp. MMGLT7]